VEAPLIELTLDSWRGAFHLQVACRFASDWTVIFGPSGAGKSTLLRLLAGLDRPQVGQIALDGYLLTDSPRRRWLQPGRHAISLVAQHSALFPHLSVAANVAYGIAGLDRASRSSRVEQMLELVGASDLAQRRPQDLSGGEAQRVSLARSLAPLPRLLLLDEPFSAMDGAASDALLARLQLWLAEHKVQTVLATHNAADAFATGAEVALLHEGRLIALGAASEVLTVERERLIRRLAP